MILNGKRGHDGRENSTNSKWGEREGAERDCNSCYCLVTVSAISVARFFTQPACTIAITTGSIESTTIRRDPAWGSPPLSLSLKIMNNTESNYSGTSRLQRVYMCTMSCAQWQAAQAGGKMWESDTERWEAVRACEGDRACKKGRFG